MQLLVSVRSGGEATAAAVGGADVIDAKDPAAGALGPVASDVLEGILAAVPPDRPVSAALGDIVSGSAARAAVRRARPAQRPLAFVKLGFRGLTDEHAIGMALTEAQEEASAGDHPTAVVAVAFADRDLPGVTDPYRVLAAAARVGVAGVLLDTVAKQGLSLLAVRDLDWLNRWLAAVRAAGPFTAIAGSLGAGDLAAVHRLGPDIVGVRGAACEGGRSGRVTAERVTRLRAVVDIANANQLSGYAC